MFKFNPRPTFTAPVTVRLPDGTVEDFSAEFVSLPIDEFNGFDLATEDGARAFLEEAFEHASDVADIDGALLTFDARLKAALINTAHVRQGLIKAYIEAHRGN